MIRVKKKMAKINTRTTQVYAQRERKRGREREGSAWRARSSRTALLERGRERERGKSGIQDSRGKIEGKCDEAEMEVGGGNMLVPFLLMVLSAVSKGNGKGLGSK